MAYSEPTWLKPKPPVGSPECDGEVEHIEVDVGDIEAERADRWLEERKEQK